MWAAPLTEDYTALAGEPRPVFEEVGSGDRAGTFARGGFFDIATDGAFAFLPPQRWAPDALVWVDRRGVSDTILTLESPQLPGNLHSIAAPRVGPEGNRIVFRGSGGDPLFQLYTYDVERTVLSSVPVDANADWPVWTPDGRSVVFNRFDEDTQDLYVARADGAGGPRPFQPPNRHQQHALDFAPDGRLIAQHREYLRAPDSDIVLLTSLGDAELEPLLDGPAFQLHAALSPDGRWLAYVSDVSGQREVYVTDFPDAATRTKVSTESAEGPAWSPDGRELFFRRIDDGAMMAVDVSTDSLFRAGIPRTLFVGRFWDCCVWGRSYDIAPDGRFLMVAISEEVLAAPRVEVVQGWLGDVRERLARRREAP